MTCINCRSAQLLSYESRRSAVWGRWTPAASHPVAALPMHVSDLVGFSCCCFFVGLFYRKSEFPTFNSSNNQLGYLGQLSSIFFINAIYEIIKMKYIHLLAIML